jgi:hypothetical protein
LREAALRAYERLRNCQIAIFAEAVTKTENELLAWYCNRMAMLNDGKPALVALYGRQPPARVIEAIDAAYLFRYYFDGVDDGAESIVLKERYGDRRFIDLCVDENEVASAIKQMATWPA